MTLYVFEVDTVSNEENNSVENQQRGISLPMRSEKQIKGRIEHMIIEIIERGDRGEKK